MADAKGRPLKFFMTAGQVSDYMGAAALLIPASGEFTYATDATGVTMPIGIEKR